MTEKQDNSENKDRNIHQRILGVMTDVSYVQKKNNAAKGLQYTFASHDQVTKALHDPLIKNGITSMTSILECSQNGNRTIVKAEVTFTNADNPDDFIKIYSFGYGIDNQDKGIGKAISYATKYAYLKCFMLETGDDPERDNIDYKAKEDNVIDKDKREELRDLLNNHRTYGRKVMKRFKYSSVEQVKESDYSNITSEMSLFAEMNLHKEKKECEADDEKSSI